MTATTAAEILTVIPTVEAVGAAVITVLTFLYTFKIIKKMI